MNEILTEKAANNLEVMRKQSRLKFSLSDKYLQQDNADLILFQNRYADLNMHYTVRRVMDDYIACMHSKEERLAELSYYAGIKDAVTLMKSVGMLPEKATVTAALEQYHQ